MQLWILLLIMGMSVFDFLSSEMNQRFLRKNFTSTAGIVLTCAGILAYLPISIFFFGETFGISTFSGLILLVISAFLSTKMDGRTGFGKELIFITFSRTIYITGTVFIASRGGSTALVLMLTYFFVLLLHTSKKIRKGHAWHFTRWGMIDAICFSSSATIGFLLYSIPGISSKVQIMGLATFVLSPILFSIIFHENGVYRRMALSIIAIVGIFLLK